VAVRGSEAARRRRRSDDEATGLPALIQASLALLQRALDLEQAALLIDEPGSADLIPIASVGCFRLGRLRSERIPEGGPWSLVHRVSSANGSALLLVARAGGAPLPPADRALAERTAEAAGRLLDQARIDTELVHARELLARADRLSALGMLAASLAHEIRNPLVSVRTFIQLLPERLADEEFRTTFRDLALGEVERIATLLSDLLAFSRPTPAQLEPTDLNELVRQLLRLLEPEARRDDVEVGFSADPTLPAVVVDDARLKQVLLNVILNAIQACPARGRVEIATRHQGEWCVVAVSDTGPGIADDHLTRIFDPFFSTKQAGSGLGLFIAQQIVTQHGGSIHAAARPEGGALFSIHLPLRSRVEDADASGL
jgi:signal transduction histidine kinase